MFYSPARRTFVVSPKFRSRLRTEDGDEQKEEERYGERGEGENNPAYNDGELINLR